MSASSNHLLQTDIVSYNDVIPWIEDDGSYLSLVKLVSIHIPSSTLYMSLPSLQLLEFSVIVINAILKKIETFASIK